MTLTEQQALDLLTKHHILRTSELLKMGVHPRTLYNLRDQGHIQQLERGLYAPASSEPLAYVDFVIVARKMPQAVLCLISALAHHELTTQIPHAVHVALPAFSNVPALTYPPLEVFRFSGASFTSGVEPQVLGGVEIRVYNAEKTIADAFKFRNRIGQDVAMEALKLYLNRSNRDINQLLHYAKICRVSGLLTTYLEALL